MDMKPEAGREGIHLAGGAAWPEILKSEQGEEGSVHAKMLGAA